MPELMEGIDAPATEGIPAAGTKDYNDWRINGPKAEAVTVEAPPSSPEPETVEAEGQEPSAAAPETAQQQPERIETRRQRTERRFNELLAKNREYEKKLAELEAKLKPAEAPSAPAAERQEAVKSDDIKSQLAELEKKWTEGKYESLADYISDVDNVKAQSREKAAKAEAEKTAKQKEFDDARNEVLKRWKASTDEARKIHADFDQIFHDKLVIPAQGIVETALLTSPVGTEIAYHLGKNPTELEAINKMSPSEASLALARLELKYPPQSAPVKKTTQVPPPPTVLTGGGTAPNDEEEVASKSGDMGRLIEIRNRRDLAAAKNKGRT